MEWVSTGSGQIELQLRREDAEAMAHSGRCDEDVEYAIAIPYIAEQLAKIDPETLRDELKEYGAWDEAELADHAQNLQRILWLLAWEIVDNPSTSDG